MTDDSSDLAERPRGPGQGPPAPGHPGGALPAASRIVETRVARELGTSQAPVREALRGLEALGVVEILPFRGARVRRPIAHELLEAYAVRAELESLGARLGVPETDGDLTELEASTTPRGMQAAAESGDRHASRSRTRRSTAA